MTGNHDDIDQNRNINQEGLERLQDKRLKEDLKMEADAALFRNLVFDDAMKAEVMRQAARTPRGFFGHRLSWLGLTAVAAGAAAAVALAVNLAGAGLPKMGSSASTADQSYARSTETAEAATAETAAAESMATEAASSPAMDESDAGGASATAEEAADMGGLRGHAPPGEALSGTEAPEKSVTRDGITLAIDSVAIENNETRITFRIPGIAEADFDLFLVVDGAGHAPTSLARRAEPDGLSGSAIFDAVPEGARSLAVEMSDFTGTVAGRTVNAAGPWTVVLEDDGSP